MAPGGLDVLQSPAAHSSLLGSCSEPNVEEPSADLAVDGVGRLGIGGGTISSDGGGGGGGSSEINGSNNDDGGVQLTCFTEVLDDVTLHFQIIRLHKQIYAWIGCNSAKFGHLYAAASTQPNNTVSVTNILGGASDNTGSGIARRLVLKTGLNVILACNIPKNSPMLEADAEKKLLQNLINLGYTRPKSNGSPS